MTGRRAGAAPRQSSQEARAVRRFFQYAGLLGLVLVSATGLAGLLYAALDSALGHDVPEDELARDLVSLAVGLPLLVMVVRWVRRTQRDPDEAASLARVVYLSAASLIALGVVLVDLHGLLSWLFGLRVLDTSAVAGLLVWGPVWWVHGRLVVREEDGRHFTPLHVLGSLTGLAIGSLGLALVVAGTLERWLGFPAEPVLAGRHDPVRAGLATLVVGALAWWWYWIRGLRDAERDDLWHAYVILAGVGGALVTTLAAGSLAIYRLAVWQLGHPGTEDATAYFSPMPETVAAAVVGAVCFGYHRQVLQAGARRERTEVDRVRDYVMAGIGLVTSAVGACLALAALIEGLAGYRTAQHTAIDTALAGMVLIGTGLPVWWFFWRCTRRAAAHDPEDELVSVTRRSYLFLLLGVSSLAAVAALLTGGYVVVADLLDGKLGVSTLVTARYPFGVVCVAGAAAAWHWNIYRADRALAGSRRSGPRFVLLLGVGDPAMARSLGHGLHSTVLFWELPDTRSHSWSEAEVLDVVERSGGLEQVVVDEDGVLRTLRVVRSPTARPPATTRATTRDP